MPLSPLTPPRHVRAGLVSCFIFSCLHPLCYSWPQGHCHMGSRDTSFRGEAISGRARAQPPRPLSLGQPVQLRSAPTSETRLCSACPLEAWGGGRGGG